MTSIDNFVNRVVQGNSIDLIKQLPENSIHQIVSDIPYGIGLDDWDVLHKNTNSAYGGSSSAQEKAGKVFKSRGKPINGWSEADRKIPYEYQEWCSTWAEEWLRVLKPGGSVFIFAGRRFAHRCIAALEDAGFCYRDMIAWNRPRAVHRAQRLSVVYGRRGDELNAQKWDGWRVGNLRPSFEPVLWFFKPYKITIADNVLENGVGAYNQDAFEKYSPKINNIINLGMASKEGGLHPAQKPVDLMRALIELTSAEGQIVLDPFAGSGSTLVAAKELGRQYIGFDFSEEYCDIANKRLEAVESDSKIQILS